mmetsp:Transcript_3603/g.10620  ORF Transcript_3603/g.10620 Transcript_3603/m.10620 type:complete len:329 (-) Transcript_3603:441-1427(-)
MEEKQAKELARQREAKLRHKLENSMIEEAALSRLNGAKIQHQWRKMMRIAKVEQLRHDLEVMSQNHEREVDMKDAIIQMLDRDLDEAEEQHQMALRSHLRNMDTLIDFFQNNMLDLRRHFEDELSVVMDQYSKERREMLQRHMDLHEEYMQILDMQKAQFDAEEEEHRQDLDSQCEEIKNKNMENLNILQSVLESQITELEKHFASAAESYSNNTKDKVQKFKEFTKRDKEAAQKIERQMKRLQRLQDNISKWRSQIAANAEESEARNGRLRGEKESLLRHFNATKATMNKMRADQAELLQELSNQAFSCETKLGKNLEQVRIDQYML